MTRIVRAAAVVLSLVAVACGQQGTSGNGASTADTRSRVEGKGNGEAGLVAPKGEAPGELVAPKREASGTLVAQKREARRRIVFLGDSLTAGYGLNREQSVPSLIQARLDDEGYDYEVINAGVSGDTSAGGLSRLDWSLEGDVDVLVIELGANDGLRGLPVAELKRNLDQIITRAKARGITVLLTGMEAPPNYGADYTAQFRKVFPDLARQHGIAFIPFYLAGVAGDPSLNISDGIHPNPAGARIVESTIWRGLEPLIEKRPS